MAIPMPGHFCRWYHEPEELHAANSLTEAQLQKWQTLNVETAELLAEFTFSVGGDSAVLLNTPQYWELRGRRALILEILEQHDEAKGTAEPPTTDVPSDSVTGNSAPAF